MEAFVQRFKGNNKAFGIYKTPDGASAEGVKVKGQAMTVKGSPTEKDWLNHLSGVIGLGIIPIDYTGHSYFGVIDIDVYPLNYTKLLSDIRENELPLIVCLSKSGGAHCYLFLKGPVSSLLVQQKLKEWAKLLGFPSAEIFPKQSKILENKGDVGQWINLPYYGSKRFALDPLKGEPMDMEQFLQRAELYAVDAETLKSIDKRAKEYLPGGPPCLQKLFELGPVGEGMRDNTLFNIAVYIKKAIPEKLEELVLKYNKTMLNPPLSLQEVTKIIRSIEKKDFNYLCKQGPIQAHCNYEICVSCKFGVVNKDQGMPVVGTLTKIQTEPPLWFVELEEGGRIQLSTDHLLSPRDFARRVMEETNILPVIPKQEMWNNHIRELLKNVSVIEAPKETTSTGIFYDLLDEFLKRQAYGSSIDELLQGKPVFIQGDGSYFRFQDLIGFLQRNVFRQATNWITAALQDMGWQSIPKTLSTGRTITAFYSPGDRFAPDEIVLSVPDLGASGI